MAVKSILGELRSCRESGQKKLAVLVDPDGADLQHFEQIVGLASDRKVDYILIGGSLIINDRLEQCIDHIREVTDIPVILFPGNGLQISAKADAILFLSLISGRNPEYLIGQQVSSAPAIRESGLEVLSTGYMLIDGGRISTTQYITQTIPIPHDKSDVAVATSMAGVMMGMSILYMDAGSGAERPVSEEMIRTVRSHVEVPLIVGGGLRDAQAVYRAARSGADVMIVGNSVERDPSLIIEMSQALQEAGTSVKK